MFIRSEIGTAAGLADCHMAAVAVDIGCRMTDLAGECILVVDHVHDDFIGAVRGHLVTGFAARAAVVACRSDGYQAARPALLR